jgi:hypothetical protein
MCLNKAVKKRERINQTERDQMREAESGAPPRVASAWSPAPHQLHKAILSWVDASTQTDKQTDKQTDRQTQCVRQTGRQTDNRQTQTQTQTNPQTNPQTQTSPQTQTNPQAYIQIHRLTDKFKDHQRGLQTYILTHRLAGKQNYRQSHSPHTPT